MHFPLSRHVEVRQLVSAVEWEKTRGYKCPCYIQYPKKRPQQVSEFLQDRRKRRLPMRCQELGQRVGVLWLDFDDKHADWDAPIKRIQHGHFRTLDIKTKEVDFLDAH